MGDGLRPATSASSTVEPSRWHRLPVMVRFGLVGAAAQVVYLVTLIAALATGLHYLLALVVAQVCTIGFAFPMHRNRVFGAEGPVRHQLLMFLGVWWTGAAASFLGVLALVEAVGLQPVPAQLIVMVVVAGWSFLANSRLSFRPRASIVVEPHHVVREVSS